MAEYNLIGKNYTPLDLVAKVTGKAKFAEDFRADGMLFAKLLLSPMPHARVRRLDAGAALAMDGVEAVLTADELPVNSGPWRGEVAGEAGLTNEPLYEGEPILALAALDETTAAEAIERIQIDLEPLPFVLDPLESLKPGGPNARLEGNVVLENRVQTLKWTARDFDEVGEGRLPMGKPLVEWSHGNLEEGFAAADLILDESIVHQSQTHHPMEPRSAMAYWQNGKLYLYGSTQSTAQTVGLIANWVGIDPSQLVLISEYTGGGFGSKALGSVNMCFPALLAKKTGRPVMLRVTRAEENYYGRARPGFQARAKIGFRQNGRITALDLYLVQDNGPYGVRFDWMSAGEVASLAYQPGAMRFRGVSVFTNTQPRGAQRGPGATQIMSMLEPILDKAARRLDIDRVSIRKLNAPDSAAKYGGHQARVTSAFVREAFDKGADLFNWEEMKNLSGRRRGSKVTGVGVGLGCYHAGSIGYDGLLTIKPDGRLTVHTGIGNLGTHSLSDTARVAADVLGVPWEKCDVAWGNTGKHLPWSSLQAGSQTIHAHTRANYAAAADAKRKPRVIAARTLGGSPDDYTVGNERVVARANPSRGMSLARAAERAIELGAGFSGQELPEELNPMTVRSAQALAGQGLMGVAKDRLPHEGVTHSFAVGYARVELDVETGDVKIVAYTVVADCGTVINPRGLAAQLHGGGVQGFGIARSQKWLFDAQWGAPLANRLYIAKPPTLLDVPLEMNWGAVDLPDPFNPVGARGIGEPPVGAGAAAILCAIADALGGDEKAYFNRSPVTTDMILNSIEALPQPFHPLTAHV